LIALFDRNDKHHADCARILLGLPPAPLVTTWPCFTEAFYFLYTTGGHPAQERLWAMRRTGRLELLDVMRAEADRMDALMTQYQNVPMDLADASLVAIAESRKFRSVFTIDSDFFFYVMADGSVLEVVR